MARKEKKGRVIRLADYRKPDQNINTVIELKLLSGHDIEYNLPLLPPQEAFRALLGCYLIAGELLTVLMGEMECREDHY